MLVTGGLDYTGNNNLSGGVAFLNQIFGWDLSGIDPYPNCYDPDNAYLKNVTNTAGTVFSDDPATLGCPDLTHSLNCNSVDCTVMYGNESDAVVAVIEHGDGIVIVLGLDFHQAGYEVDGFHADCADRRNDWIEILRSSLYLGMLVAAGLV